MIKLIIALISASVLFTPISCAPPSQQQNTTANNASAEERTILTGADQLDAYLPLLKGKKVGLMGNQTAISFIS